METCFSPENGEPINLNETKLNKWKQWNLTTSILLVVKITSKLTGLGQTFGRKAVINERFACLTVSTCDC